MKRMKLKKSNNNKSIYIIFFVFLILTIYYSFKGKSFSSSNEVFVNNIFNYSNLSYNENSFLYNDSFDFISNPVSMIDKVFAYNDEKFDSMEFLYIQNTVVSNPRVYIYSTHPNEKYSDNEFSVIDASLILQEKLNSIGIQTIVEPRNTEKYMKDNNITNYYIASRQFLSDALKINDFDLVIDLHRDYIPNNASTKTVIGDKRYAKVMFVMNKNYENIEFAKKFNQIIYNDYPSVTRGVYDPYKDTFNQDLTSCAVLIELGSTQNDYVEIVNSIDVLVEAIKELLDER